MSQLFQFYSPTSMNPKHFKSAAAAPDDGVVVSIQCLSSISTTEELADHLFQTGDIVEELAVEGYSAQMRSPFRRGSAGVQEFLYKAYKNNKTSVLVRVRRGTGGYSEMQACISPKESGKRKKKEKQYVLRALRHPGYIMGFCDRSEKECLQLQASRNTRMMDEANSWVLKDGFVSYDWDRKMKETLSIPNSSCFLSILFLPKASDHDLEEALTRANAWLNASQNCGVPIVFMNIQTESLISTMSEDTASFSSRTTGFSYSARESVASSSRYGYEDCHGNDRIGVVRGVRLWYAPAAEEFSIEVKIRDGSTKLGFSLSRTDEGFIYISAVDELADENAAAAINSGLTYLYKEARRSSQLLIVSRISNQKVLPRLVSADGEIRCYDAVSISRKLSLHCHAKLPIIFHVFSPDETVMTPSSHEPHVRSPTSRLDRETSSGGQEAEKSRAAASDELDLMEDMDEAGTFSLRFHDLAIDEQGRLSRAFSASSSDHVGSI